MLIKMYVDSYIRAISILYYIKLTMLNAHLATAAYAMSNRVAKL